jgi:hypothetical protein
MVQRFVEAVVAWRKGTRPCWSQRAQPRATGQCKHAQLVRLGGSSYNGKALLREDAGDGRSAGEVKRSEMKAELVPENGDPPIPIERDVTVVGRHESCDVVITHQSLSKRHCVFVKTDGLLVLRDLATTNGTKVKGQRVRWAALLPDDKISLGGYKIRVYLGSDEMPSPSEQKRGRAGQPGSSPRAGALLQGPTTPTKGAEPVPPSGSPRPAVAGFPAPSNHGEDDQAERWDSAFVAPGGQGPDSARVAAAAPPGAGFEVIDEPRFELVEDDEEIIDLE